ncbi:MAG: CPBP family intramembrane metalloprotease [Planctomycetaceae bacterium]|nr:CPBP family intramembrane metalloprotease [Planctomycetaceae bacterium]
MGLARRMACEMRDAQINRFVLAAFAFEAALGLGAIVAGLLLAVDPLSSVRLTENSLADHSKAVIFGVAATLPLLLGLVIVTRLQFEPFVRLCQFVNERLTPLFAPLSLFELAAVSIAAGFGEEILFRGLIQSGLAARLDGTNGVLIALVVSSILFGVCHWITPTYGVLAGLAGAYFGLLFIWSGNLLTPLVAHALYDFIALAYLTNAERGTGDKK